MIIKLFENYKQIEEISDLAHEILKGIAIEFKEKTLEYKKDDKVGFIFIPHYYLYNIEHSKFDILKDFIKSFPLAVKYKTTESKGTRGNFYSTKDKNYITIFYDMEVLLKKMNDIYKNKYETNDLDDHNDYYYALYFHSHDTLMHELQHAYDSYRSEGKFVNTRFENDVRKTMSLKNIGKEIKLKDEDLKFIEKNRKEYYKIPHEVNARYTQAIKETSFYDVKRGFHNFEMKSYKEVLESFILNFMAWHRLSAKMQKRLKNRLYKDWVMAKGIIENEELD